MLCSPAQCQVLRPKVHDTAQNTSGQWIVKADLKREDFQVNLEHLWTKVVANDHS